MRLKKAAAVFLCAASIIATMDCSVKASVNDNSSELEQKLEEAYVYTLPLMLVDATAAKMTNTVEATSTQAPVNQLIHARGLANADSKNVVTPNVDTVYSQVYLDLSEDAVILEMPKTERFCMAEVLDAYTNCISLMDAASFENSSEKFIFTGKSFDGEVPDGMTEIKCPTDLAWVIIRTLCSGDEDLENVYEIQSGMDTYTLSQYASGSTEEKSEGTYDAKYDYIPVQYLMGLSMEDYFTKANQLMEENPPAEEDSALMETLKEINVGPGLTFDSTVFGDSSDSLWEKLVSGISAACTEKSAKFIVQNGVWNYFGEPIAEFGTEYDYRALVALGGLGANPVSVAVYPKATTDSEGGRLNGANRYVLHFDKENIPETLENGFWSVTLYNSSDNLLSDNELDRYCINDRSDIEYNEDGSFDIYIQNEKPTDDLIKNWLPAPTGDFHLYLRVYLPDEKIISNEWEMPSINILEEE
ncbi:MAG: DUF1214 domain-containing protein [Eubacteriales bacterium]|nr:DUF1214 domain-containing protein [Eubacteriales bacterium]